MTVFVLKNNYFEFDRGVFQQISGTAIGTKFAPPYECIFMDQHEIVNPDYKTLALVPLYT